MKFSRRVGNELMNKRLNFDGDPDQGSGYGSGFRIYATIHVTGKTCLGGGMQYPSISSYNLVLV